MKSEEIDQVKQCPGCGTFRMEKIKLHHYFCPNCDTEWKITCKAV